MASEAITLVSNKKRLKTQKFDKLQVTKRRTMNGSFLVVDGETNIDPVGHLMGKRHSRVFQLNENDLANMMTKHSYRVDKAIAYVEAVSQLPEHNPGSLAYTNDDHPPPSQDDGVRIDFETIEWFANAWKGNSWKKSINDEGGGPPCFWTKDRAYSTESHTRDWRTYDAKFPRRGWRVTYDEFPRYEDVLTELKRFLYRYPSGSHVWIQGTLEGQNPTDTVMRLRRDIAATASQGAMAGGALNMVYTSYWKTRLEYSNDIMFFYANRAPQRIPVIPWRVSNHGMRLFNGALKPQLYPSSTWMTKHGLKPPYTQDEIYSNYSGFVELIPIEDEDEVDFAWKRVGENKYIMSSPHELLTFVDGDTIVEYPHGARFWETGNYEPYKDREAMIDAHMLTFRKYMSEHPRAVILSNGGGDMARKYRNEMRGVVTISFKELERHMASRVAEGNEYQPTDPHQSMNNQMEYIRVLPEIPSFHSIHEPGLYMATSGAGKSTFVEEKANAEVNLYKVRDPKFFLGLGSVSTAQHGAYGIGRDEASLAFQTRRKVETGHDTSGHMIASVLCPRSHLLWYLEEVYINMTTKKSIYIVPFNEPTDTMYHSIDEYKNAIIDMKKLDSSRTYPGYARNQVGICRSFVELFN